MKGFIRNLRQFVV